MFWFGLILANMGQCEAATPLIEKLISIDPVTPIYQAMPGWIAHMDGRLPESLGPYRKMYEMDPDSHFIKFAYALELAVNGQIDEATPLLQQAAELEPASTWGRYSAFLNHALHDRHDEAMAAATSELNAWGKSDGQYSWMVAGGYALICETDKALEFLENAVDIGLVNYPLLSEHDPFLERIRSDVRFGSLMERVMFEWDQFELE